MWFVVENKCKMSSLYIATIDTTQAFFLLGLVPVLLSKQILNTNRFVGNDTWFLFISHSILGSASGLLSFDPYFLTLTLPYPNYTCFFIRITKFQLRLVDS